MFFFLYFYAYSINKNKIYTLHHSCMMLMWEDGKKIDELNKCTHTCDDGRTDQEYFCTTSVICTQRTRYTHTHFSHYNIFLLFLYFSSASSQSIITCILFLFLYIQKEILASDAYLAAADVATRYWYGIYFPSSTHQCVSCVRVCVCVLYGCLQAGCKFWFFFQTKKRKKRTRTPSRSEEYQ